MPTLLLAIHVIANVVWIGSILSCALLASRAAGAPNAAEIGGLARLVYRRLAAPAFGVSFLFGFARMSLAMSVYAHLGWFHAKLTFAVIVIALHHVIGARVRKIEGGDAGAAKGMPLLGWITFAAAAAATFLGVAKAL